MLGRHYGRVKIMLCAYWESIPILTKMYSIILNNCISTHQVRYHGAVSRRQVVGYVIVGHSAGGEGTRQWRQLMDFSYHEQNYKIKPHKPVGLP